MKQVFIFGLLLVLSISFSAKADLIMSSKIVQVDISEARDVATNRNYALVSVVYIDYSTGQMRSIYLSGDPSSRIFDRCDNILTTAQGQANKRISFQTRSAASFASTDGRYITHYLVQWCGYGELNASGSATPYPGGTGGSTSGGGGMIPPY